MQPSNPEQAYWNFFRSFNTRDAYEFSAALHYPHIRLSWRGEPTIIADIETHALQATWDTFIATGWDHTEGAEPRSLHRSDGKCHLIGGWTRVTKSGDPILSNRVCYIITKIDGRWGIQCRFGMDDASALNDEPKATTNAMNTVKNWQNAVSKGDGATARGFCERQCYEIGIGQVSKIQEEAPLTLQTLTDATVEVIQSGNRASTFALTSEGSNVLLYLTSTNDWKIKAISWL